MLFRFFSENTLCGGRRMRLCYIMNNVRADIIYI